MSQAVPNGKLSDTQTTTVRVHSETRATLQKLAEQTQSSMEEVVAQAVESYRRQLILEGTNAAYAAMRADPIAWQEELDERAVWDRALLDGLDDE